MATILYNLRGTFRQLRWKLALSYTSVTVGTLLISILALAILVFSMVFLPYDRAPKGMWVQAANEQAVPLARMLLSESPPDTAGIADLVNYSDTARFESVELARMGNVTLFARATAGLEMFVFDAEGTLLGRTGYPAFPGAGQAFDVGTIPRLEAPLRAALEGERDPDRLVSAGVPGSRWAVAVPVFDSSDADDHLLGAVAYVLDAMPTEGDISSHTLGLAGRSVLLFLLGAGVVGTCFGLLTARGMMRRFERLSAATDAWSRGDFSEFIDDPTGDEISQLARRLNRMAGQLQSLLKRRQAMAISEERNRLARDLHDSAKQQALAASFQLGTAITLFERDPQAARRHLVEADGLVDSVRRELTDLILELRPPAINGRDFDETLNEYAVEWAHQNGIDVDVRVQDKRELPLAITQTLYRIVQEALANVARHSAATSVGVVLSYGPDSVTLTITDDGRGFDTREQQGGMGLQSMRERAESLDGHFAVESAPGQGTTICVTLPTD